MDHEKNRLEEWLERMQSADDSTKRLWLVVSVGLVSVVIVFLWVANFSFMMSGYAVQATTVSSGDAAVSDAPASPSFFATIGHGLATIRSGLSQGMHALGNAFAAQREDIVKPP